MQFGGEIDVVDVCLSAKIRILKQITTIGEGGYGAKMMFVLAQRYEF